MTRRVIVAFGATALALLFTPSARAHVVHIAWKVTDTGLVVVASFSDDLPADDAEITLFGPDGSAVAAGRTDDTGTWRGPKPPPGTYRLTVQAMPNHSQSVPVEIAPPAGTGGGGQWWHPAAAVTVVVAALVLGSRRRKRRQMETGRGRSDTAV